MAETGAAKPGVEVAWGVALGAVVGMKGVELGTMIGWAVKVAATEVASRLGGGSAAGRLQPASSRIRTNPEPQPFVGPGMQGRRVGVWGLARWRGCENLRASAIESAGEYSTRRSPDACAQRYAVNPRFWTMTGRHGDLRRDREGVCLPKGC